MENNDKTRIEFHMLLDRLFDGMATEEDMIRIQELVRKDLKLQEYYFRCVELKSGLHQLKGYEGAPGVEDADYYDDALAELAKYENAAQGIEIPRQAVEQALIQKVVYPPREKRKVSKLSICFLAMNAAAVLLLVLFIKFAPEKPYRLEVATLVDQMNAAWSPSAIVPENGSRLWTNEAPLHLKKGIVKIRYDNDVDVVIEGPAVFEIERTGLFLEYGRLYSHVSRAGMGFTVNTLASQFVDHGTEFGLQVNGDSSSELHVIKGNVQMFAGLSGASKISQIITANRAVRYDATRNIVTAIPVKQHAFARQIDSQSEMVWRGRMSVNLADIVGGGNGFGTGRQDFGIVIATGKPSQQALFITGHGHLSEKNWGNFCPVPEIPGIDGIFVPDGGSGPVSVSSRGDVFEACPDTNGCWSGPITNGAQSHRGDFQLVVDNVSYGTPTNPALYLHANAGITYDLSAIRANLPAGQSISRFSSLVVLPRRPMNPPTHVDVWVLVDGKVRFYKTNVPQSQSFTVDVPLAEQDGFLSLAVTDGMNDKQNESEIKNGFDWCFFCRPELVLSAN